MTYIHKEDYEKAIEDFTKGIELEPENTDVYSNRGMAYTKKEDYEKAIEDFTKAIKLDPENAEVYSNRGVAYGYKGDFKEALANYTESIRINPHSSIVYFNRGMVYATKEDYKESIADFKISISLKPSPSFFIFENIYYFHRIRKINDAEFEDLVKDILNHDMSEPKRPDKKTLYRYRNYSPRTIEAIINEEISFSDSKFFNDPADPPFKLLKHKQDANVVKNIEKITNKIKIASLSENNNNILMWSHYADSHKGLCIEYDISKFNHKNYIIKKVIYNEELKFNEKTAFFIMQNKPQNESPFLSFFYIKHEDWEYENEYRIISYDIDADCIELPIKAIYFGTETPTEDIERIKKVLSNRKIDKKIDLYQMQTDSKNLFELNSVKIS